ncbi:General negative regulator of transcription subunit 2 [Hanseniaspora opuntiae]|uniref:General negative regulator of transcription subunit 2 n=1 Tax=Hanseniaspora opuntiae TaxID=211096 RepID=A0A1E5RTN0_9ASCO|nr:General negative regulator of transcription subunit 2 [Hanseniaspora opuntiae]
MIPKDIAIYNLIMSSSPYTLQGLLNQYKYNKTNNKDSATGIDLSTILSCTNNSFNEKYSEGSDKSFKTNRHQLDILQSPWLETSINDVEPRFFIPKSFKNINVKFTNKHKNGLNDNKFNDISEESTKVIESYNDETLFYLFYKHPGTVIQELSYLQLRARNWRYHKTLKLWLTKLPDIEPVMFPDSTGERGFYYFWDNINWCKKKKEFELLYSAIM